MVFRNLFVALIHPSFAVLVIKRIFWTETGDEIDSCFCQSKRESGAAAAAFRVLGWGCCVNNILHRSERGGRGTLRLDSGCRVFFGFGCFVSRICVSGLSE